MKRLAEASVRQSGFSLVEVLVAVAVAALAFLVLADLQNQMTRGHRAFDRAEQRAVLNQAALNLISSLNPMEACEGSEALDAHTTMSWSCTELEPPRRATGFPVGDGAFEVALYEVNVSLRDESDREISRLVVERVGFRRLFPPDEPGQAGV